MAQEISFPIKNFDGVAQDSVCGCDVRIPIDDVMGMLKQTIRMIFWPYGVSYVVIDG